MITIIYILFFILSLEDFFAQFMDFLNNFGYVITGVSFFLGLYYGLKNKIVNKIAKGMGREKLMDYLIIMDELTKYVPVEELDALLLKYKRKLDFEMAMKESNIFIGKFIGVRITMSSNDVQRTLREYKDKKEIAEIQNRKRWNVAKKNPVIKKSINALATILRQRMKMQAIKNKQFADTLGIEEIFKERQDKIEKHREIRKSFETKREKEAFDRLDKEKLETGKKLHKVFKAINDFSD